MGFLQTFLLTEAAVFGGLGLVVRFLVGRHAGHSVRIWTVASTLLAVSQAILAFRLVLPPLIGFAGFQLCWFLGHAGMLEALRGRVFNFDVAGRWMLLLILHLMIFWQLHLIGVKPRLAYVGVVAATFSALQARAAWHLWQTERLKGGLLISITHTAWALVLGGSFLLIMSGQPIPEYIQAGTPITFIHTTGMMAVLMLQAGFVSLVLERAASEQAMANAVAERETERRLETEAANQQLKQMLDERAEMLDLLAHEIRQPLNTAAVALEGLTPRFVSPEKRMRSGQALRVIDGVMLTLSNVLTAATTLQRRAPDIRPCDAAEAAQLARLSFPAGMRKRILLECPAELPLRTDAELLSLALRNLMDNGLKHGDGAVTLKLGRSGGELRIRASNKAANPGAPERLFDKGRRGPNSHSSGAGLGLHIVKRIVELLQGSARAQWRAGEFRIELRIPA